MRLPFAIHGLGRIGRALVRAARHHPTLDLVAIGDLADAPTLARLLARDTVHGPYPGRVHADGDSTLLLDGRRVEVFRSELGSDATPPWERTGACVVVEATGTALTRERAARHLRGDVATVIISALAEDADLTLCPGICWPGTEDAGDPPNHQVLSAASCTTHCLALLVDVLHRAYGVRRALMNEVHSYTGDQRLVDGVHRDPRRGRAAASNIVPTYSAAPAAVERLLPSLAGRLSGQAIRVPTPDVALLDLVVTLDTTSHLPTKKDVVATFRAAAAKRHQGLLAVSDEPLVSSDHIGNPCSAIVDAALTEVLGGPPQGDALVRVAAWYDNEYGYACRLAELIERVGQA